jgi:hypothetical protein
VSQNMQKSPFSRPTFVCDMKFLRRFQRVSLRNRRFGTSPVAIRIRFEQLGGEFSRGEWLVSDWLVRLVLSRLAHGIPGVFHNKAVAQSFPY